ncbi:MAG: YdcF family protein [Methyloversatilis sp.]|jgi:uncharacterized SAM-binding protein YcdF (DUF218 family)|nr:YdcF family protein [Methyloversatilis sp.]MBP6195332.1 YdcF family protein [Methyloversatilis sp.]MBP9118215.1 YdcF family protein [Methyloversatilis sp.]
MLASLLFALKKLVSLLLLPPNGPLLLSAAGLLLVRRHARLGYAVAWAGLLLIVALSTPLISGWLERSTYVGSDADSDLSGAQAIVILGGGTHSNLTDYGGETVSALALERLRAGARLARERGLPVLVSGGIVWEGRPEAEMMKDALAEYGVTVSWVEARSRDTGDNARESARRLGEEGINRVAVVTHAFHMRRSMEQFRRAGLTPIAVPTIVRRAPDVDATDFIPNMRALQQSGYALHEWLGWAALALSRGE